VERRAFIGTLAGGLLAAPLAAEAQQAGKVWRVGYLDQGYKILTLEAFQRGLRDLGWVEGKNVAFENSVRRGEKRIASPRSPPNSSV